MKLCIQCNKNIAVKRFCSLQCYWNSLKEKSTWNRQKRYKKKCLYCEQIFEVRESLKDKRKFCSTKCHQKYQVGKKLPSRGGKVKVICKQCNKEFTAWRYDIGRKYCSKKCLGLANKIKMTGKNHWNWKGGISPRVLNTVEYREWRTKVFERDNYTCQMCGYDKGRILHAHHKKYWANYPKLRFKISNGIALCKPCHEAIHLKKVLK